MKWYERVTEAAWFKRAYDPETKVGWAVSRTLGGIFVATAVASGIIAGGTVNDQLGPADKRDCASNPLRHVYSPKRLEVLKTCVELDVTVVEATKERDGDYHIRVKAPKKWLSPQNYRRQGGHLVVEYMPGDPYDRPRAGDRLHLLGTWVSDTQHGGWREIHPVFYVQPKGRAATRIVP